MKMYMIASQNPRDDMAGSINAVLAVGADEAGARAATLLAKPNGEFDAGRFAAWSAYLVADGTITLPQSASVQFLGRAHGNGVNPLPGA